MSSDFGRGYADVRQLMSVGEEELAFDTMCSWIYEDSLPIAAAYYERLVSAVQELGTPKSTDRLDEPIEE
ncbi:MafI family immunity protein [Streptomyces sp. NBC_01525]|uniref:MafI family immunity protein n=1 Tax=Streptomyces sp. NBC_01525 TaxID=2903893 RepID=UPI00386CBCC6